MAVLYYIIYLIIPAILISTFKPYQTHIIVYINISYMYAGHMLHACTYMYTQARPELF